MGEAAGLDCDTGSNNVFLGQDSGRGGASGNITTGSNNVVLGNASTANLFCTTSTISTSDARDKADVEDFNFGLSWINKLRPVTYRWDRRDWYGDDNPSSMGTPDGSKKKNKINIGFLAQEFIEIEKEHGYADKKDNFLVAHQNEDEENPSYGIKYERLVPILVNAVKELSAKVTALEAG